MTHVIPFTMFSLPNGRRSPDEFPTERDDVYEKSQAIIKAGFRFEAEVLLTNTLHATISDDNNDWSSVLVMASEADQTVERIEKMIMDFDIEAATKLTKQEETGND